MPASKVGTIDPMDTKSRVYVDENLNEVGAGTANAAFVYNRADLARVKTQREQAGFTNEPARVQAESRKAALAGAEADAAAANAKLESLRESVAADEAASKDEAKAEAKAK